MVSTCVGTQGKMYTLAFSYGSTADLFTCTVSPDKFIVIVKQNSSSLFDPYVVWHWRVGGGEETKVLTSSSGFAFYNMEEVEQ